MHQKSVGINDGLCSVGNIRRKYQWILSDNLFVDIQQFSCSEIEILFKVRQLVLLYLFF